MIGSVRQRSTFRRFRSDAIRVRHGWLQVAYLSPTHGDGIDVAFALNRSVGNAVHRNRLRRQIRHVLIELAAANDARLVPGQYLLMVRGPRTGLSHGVVVDTVTGALERLAERR